MNRWIKRIGLVILAPVVLLILISVSLYIPPLQNFAIERATEYASKSTGMDISIGKIRLSFPLKLVVGNIQVVNPPADTLLSLNELHVRIKLMPLLKKRVEIDAVEIQQVAVNSGKLIQGMHLKGTLGKLHLKANYVDLANEHATLNEISLADTDLTLFMNDTTQTVPDSTTSRVNWKLLVEALQVKNVSFQLKMPADSLFLSTRIGEGKIKNATVDLLQQKYGIDILDISGSSLAYNKRDSVHTTTGFDPSNLLLSELSIVVDSVFNQGMAFAGDIRRLSFTEQSGLQVTSLTGNVSVDSLDLIADHLKLTTPYSDITVSAKGNMTALHKIPSGQIGIILDASLGKPDAILFASVLPEDFRKAYPDKPFTLRSVIDGNLDKIYLRSLDAELPGAFKLHARGQGEAIADSIRRSAEINLDGETGNLDFILCMIDSTARKKFAIPRLIRLDGKAALNGGSYRTRLNIRQGQGRINLNAQVDSPKESYGAVLTVDSLQLKNFLPQDSLGILTANIEAKGKGFDPFSAATNATLQGELRALQYGTIPFSDIKIGGSLLKQQIKCMVNSSYEPMRFNLDLDGNIRKDEVKGLLTLDVGNFDLEKFGLSDEPASTSFLFLLGAESDLKKMYKAGGKLSNWKIITPKETVTPKEIVFTAQTNKDTTTLNVRAGDLLIKLAGDNDAEGLAGQFSRFSTQLAEQIEKESLDLEALRKLYPHLQMQITAGKDNPVYNFLSMKNITFNDLSVRLETSPETGLKGNAGIYSLAVDTLQLDTIQFTLRQDTSAIFLNGGVINNTDNKQHVFQSRVHTQIRNTEAEALFSFIDGTGATGLNLGVRVQKEPEGFAFRMYPDDPIVAFQKFRLNPDNFIRIGKDKEISANFKMEGINGTALLFSSLPDTGKVQALDLDIRKLNLSLISKLSPYSPNIGGLFNTSILYNIQDSTYFINAEAGIDSLSYEQKPMGDFSVYADYLPGTDKSHHLDARILHNQKEVLTAKGSYARIESADSIQSRINIHALPLWIANAFIPDGMASIAGAVNGEISVNGSSSVPEINGSVSLDTTSVFVNMAGTRFKFDDKPIQIENNKLIFNRYGITSSGKNPFIIDGTILATDPARMLANLNLSAENMELLNVKRNKESLVYGKVYVDLNSSVKGPLDALVMRGNLQLLGNTDLTYILKDSPLTVQDRLADLVTFVNFADTTAVEKEESVPLKLGGLDMLMTIHIDQAVRLKVDLSEDRESRVELEGGGDLSFQYTPQGDMVLTGRYTLSGGLIQYALPVIPSKTFNIQNGSYVQWNGNAMDPTLNITAIERVRTSVTIDDQAPRLVNFDVSIAVKNQLENLSVVFNLSAPEDLTVQNQLSAMSDEERSKQAVSMLVTNMYMASGSSGKMNMNMGNALNSFLQNEINNMLGSALKGVDVSFGMESYDQNGDGANNQTDYSFRFSKRFYNDRIRVIIGGSISTGAPENQNQTFIDNISVEYRLDASGTRYIRLFHNKNYESILEGEITETGAGIVLRKKMRKLKELFIFKRKKKQETESISK